MKKFLKNNINMIIPVLIFIAAAIFVMIGTSKVSERSGTEGKQALQKAVQRAVVQCYAIEGAYPEDIEYLEEHYGLYVNHDKYVVHYEIFASNIMPNIIIISKKVENG